MAAGMVSDTRVERSPGLVVVKYGWIMGSCLAFCGWQMGSVDETPVACLGAFLYVYETNVVEPTYPVLSVTPIIEFYEHCEWQIHASFSKDTY